MGTSDIHGLIDWDFVGGVAGHRPLTLVFARDRSEASVKEALFNRRTVAVFKELLIGREEFLNPLIQQSLSIKKAVYSGKSTVLSVTIENKTNTVFTVINRSGYTLHAHHDVLTLQPGDQNIIELKTREKLGSVNLSFEILNAVYAPEKHPTLTWPVKVE
jgi:hypothetical protein